LRSYRWQFTLSYIRCHDNLGVFVMVYHPLLVAVPVVLILVQLMTAAAQTGNPSPTAESILNALKANEATRGGMPAMPPAKPAAQVSPHARSVLNALLGKQRSRGLSEPELEQLGEAADNSRSIDLTIYFEFNSDVISAKAMPTMMALGQALSDPSLSAAEIMLAGHTDAKGSAAYNRSLSERRAKAVRRFLITNFKLPEARLEAVGFGKQRLKNRTQPFADENRRVQVVNLSAMKQ